MAENMEMPPAEEPANKNRTIIIVVVVLVVLCCCCIVLAGLWQYGDQIMYELGLQL